jgi:hypothetical protein
MKRPAFPAVAGLDQLGLRNDERAAAAWLLAQLQPGQRSVTVKPGELSQGRRRLSSAGLVAVEHRAGSLVLHCAGLLRATGR